MLTLNPWELLTIDDLIRNNPTYRLCELTKDQLSDLLKFYASEQ